MPLLSHVPGPPLSAFVERLWFLSDAPPHPRERIVPGGTSELVVNLVDDDIRIHDTVTNRVRSYSGTVVSGAFSRFFEIETRQHAAIVGVHFRPGGAYPFIGAPAHDLADSHVDVEALWGGGVRILREQLCAAASPADRFRLLECALLDRLKHPVRRHAAIPHALAQLERGDAGIAAVVQSTQLSHRRLIEVFRTEVGMTPKLFARVRRFERAAALARRTTTPWAQLALACGYSDQSHMISDFAAFTGFTPAEFMRHSSDRVKDGHVLA